MYTLVSSSLVEQDIKEAFYYYKSISRKLAKEFLQRLKEGKNYIMEYPFANDIMYKNVRIHMLKQFPYHIHYLIEPEEKQIIILGVSFAKRNDSNYNK